MRRFESCRGHPESTSGNAWPPVPTCDLLGCQSRSRYDSGRHERTPSASHTRSRVSTAQAPGRLRRTALARGPGTLRGLPTWRPVRPGTPSACAAKRAVRGGLPFQSYAGYPLYIDEYNRLLMFTAEADPEVMANFQTTDLAEGQTSKRLDRLSQVVAISS